MKLFFVGGTYDGSAQDGPAPDPAVLRSSMRELGRFLAGRGHDFILCSPYPGSIDLEVLTGAAVSGNKPRIEMHFPETQENLAAVQNLATALDLPIQMFAHAANPTDSDQGKRYAWLLSQLSALDAAHVVVAAAGNPVGSANMFLHLAEARRSPILPFGHLGGAAAKCLERQRYVLEDRLGELKSWLQSPAPMDRIADALDLLTAPLLSTTGVVSERRRFFISYPRAKAAEADLIETLLRRRDCMVFRDDQSFDPSRELQQEIEQAIRGSHVFIALWSAEYACSPWCYDEIALALQLRSAGELEVWLLQLDDTRIVPPGARKLISQPCRSREELQSTVLKLLDAAG